MTMRIFNKFGLCSLMMITLAMAGSVHGQCRSDEVLIGEDSHYWYCSSTAQSSDVMGIAESLEERPELLGEQWQFRKALIDAVGSLAQKGTPYVYGGKIRLTAGGQQTYVCVTSECRGDLGVGVDCSGASEYGELSACFVSGFYKASAYSLSGLWGLRSANEQAEYFKQYKSFEGKSDKPSPGDLVFFEKTAPHKGITHVAIFLGRTNDGHTMILHASSRQGRVVFAYLDSFLSKRVAGYGNISKLYVKFKQKR